ncbi:MAG: hypothetical protein IPL55_20670 [Saprospiraceae bacterium]|nr:hypothetical protein [Saprospiraceae bacterium]MBL0026552.1 hypothetical protein [Saprospiraceae bacterium]
MAPFLRYYPENNENGNFFGQVNFSYYCFSSNSDSQSLNGYGAKVGYSVCLNKCVSIETGYAYNKMVNNNIILSIILGLQIHFKKAKEYV